MNKDNIDEAAIRMEKIQWRDSYSVGNSTLDDQHQNIIALVNRFIDKPELSTAEILDQLNVYAEQHLRYEEALLAKHGYPEHDEHCESHFAYQKKVTELELIDYSDKQLAREELMKFLSVWWVDHILKEDMLYRDFLSNSNNS